MSLVLNTDFINEWKISQQCADELDVYITRYEKHYLTLLLGADLYTTFIGDLNAATPQVPQSAIYLAIYNPFDIDDSSCVRTSEGMRLMLIQLIYFHFVRDQVYNNSPIGMVKGTSSTSGQPTYQDNLVESYNRGVRNFHEIQWYICENDADYPTENVQPLRAIWGG